jgi:hypothetical protein
MTLIKSKINSLAWLKSAIYISVVGGVILSSKSASAFALFVVTNNPLSSTAVLQQPIFAFGPPDTLFPIVQNYTIGNEGSPWLGAITTTENRQSDKDVLSLSGFLQHMKSPHEEDNPSGNPFVFSFTVDAQTVQDNQITSPTSVVFSHPENHSDLFTAILTANLSHTADSHRITNWNFALTGEHKSEPAPEPEPVPEPLTMLGAAAALGYGAILKRKSSQMKKS